MWSDNKKLTYELPLKVVAPPEIQMIEQVSMRMCGRSVFTEISNSVKD